MIRRRPAAASRPAMAVASRGPVVNALSISPSPSASAPRTRAQRASDNPAPERGLTMTSGRPRSTRQSSNRRTPGTGILHRPHAPRYPPRARRQRLLGAGQRRRAAGVPHRGHVPRPAVVAGARGGDGGHRRRRPGPASGPACARRSGLDRGRGRVGAAGLPLPVLRLRARPPDAGGTDHVVVGGDRRRPVAVDLRSPARPRRSCWAAPW